MRVSHIVACTQNCGKYAEAGTQRTGSCHRGQQAKLKWRGVRRRYVFSRLSLLMYYFSYLQNVSQVVVSQAENIKRLSPLGHRALLEPARTETPQRTVVYHGASPSGTNRDVTASMAAVLSCLLFSSIKNGK